MLFNENLRKTIALPSLTRTPTVTMRSTPNSNPAMPSLLPPDSDKKNLPLLPEIALFQCGPSSDELRYIHDNGVCFDENRLPWLLAYTLTSHPHTTSGKELRHLVSRGAQLDDTRLPSLLQETQCFQPGQSVALPRQLWPATSPSAASLSSVLDTTFKLFGPEDERVLYLIRTKKAAFSDLPGLLRHVLSEQEKPLTWAIFLENSGARLDPLAIQDLLLHLHSQRKDAEPSAYESSQSRVDFLLAHLLFSQPRHPDALSVINQAIKLGLVKNSSTPSRAILKLVVSDAHCKIHSIISQLPPKEQLQLLAETSQRHLIRPLLCQALAADTQPDTPHVGIVSDEEIIATAHGDVLHYCAPCLLKCLSGNVIDVSSRGYPHDSLRRVFHTFITTGVYDPSTLRREDQLYDLLTARHFGVAPLLGVMRDVMDEYPSPETLDEFEAEYFVAESFG